MGLIDRIRETSENSGGASQQRQTREHKFILKSWFTPAEVVKEPEEILPIVTAGLREKHVEKEYSDSYFRRGFEIIKGDFAKLIRSALFFIASTIPILLCITLGLTYFENYILGGNYNFVSNIGVGYPGIGDSINEAMAIKYWNVYEPILLMAAAVAFISSIFMSGLFYCMKRIYFQDSFKKIVKTFFMGIQKYWWQYMVTTICGVLIFVAMPTTIFYLLQQQSLGTASAGAYCAVVFTFIFGAPLLLIPMTMMSQFVTYNLSFVKTFKNAIVFILNTPFSLIIFGIVAIAPVVALFTSLIWQILIFVICALIGFIAWSLFLIVLGRRSMDKCKYYLAVEQKKIQKINKQNNPTANQSKKKKPQQAYQNPKKKKKK